MYYKNYLASTAMLLGMVYSVQSQTQLNGNLGWPFWPTGETPIDSLGYQGENGDMTGGYQIGETVADFTVYDFSGNPLTLSEKLAGDKPVIILSGSVTCNRFRDIFDPNMETQQNLITKTFMFDNADNFEWIFIYNVEAHPSDGWCPSNCYDSAQLDTTVLQHPDYHYRRFAMRDWLNSDDHYFPFNMYADNPDNSVYDNFFKRPSGLLVLNCEGVVQLRGDWTQIYVPAYSDQILALLNEPFQNCDWLTEEEEEEEETGNAVSESFNSHTLRVYPNPAGEVINFESTSSGTLTVYDSFGRMVKSQRIHQGTQQISVYGLPAGVYSGVLLDSDIAVSHFRFTKN